MPQSRSVNQSEAAEKYDNGKVKFYIAQTNLKVILLLRNKNNTLLKHRHTEKTSTQKPFSAQIKGSQQSYSMSGMLSNNIIQVNILLATRLSFPGFAAVTGVIVIGLMVCMCALS